MQPARHAPLAVEFNWGVLQRLRWPGPGVVWQFTQLVWQFADCELQDIMQFVTAEVTVVESP